MVMDATNTQNDQTMRPDFAPADQRVRGARSRRTDPGDGFYARRGKRILDIVGAVVLLVAFLPLILMIAALMLTQRGPVLFGHRRIGRQGAEFDCLKFRTMVVDAEDRLEAMLARDPEARRQWQLDRKLDDDPRITGTGRFLRRTSLDELPQLVNVLRGDMSLVGPRPVTATELERYGEAASSYLSLRPGLTGKWQVGGRNKMSYAGRVALDDEYARTYSAMGDVMVLFRTVGVVLGATGK